MKALIVYCSAGGRTQRVAQEIAAALPFEKDLVKLESVEELGFLKKLRATSVPIKETVTDCGPYDLVVIGAPVWTHKANPVATSWIKGAQNLDGKSASVFVTYRFSAGGSPAATRTHLEAKGATVLGSLAVRSLFAIGAAKLEEARAFGKELSDRLM